MVTGFIFLLVGAGGLFWLAYRRPRPRRWWLLRRIAARAVVSGVDRQHRHLQAGGLIGEGTFETTKTRLRNLLAVGRCTEIETGLRAGLDFAVQVRALAEIGTVDAAIILERVLARSLSRDPVEQAWYWADLAAGLRKLHRETALPAVLRCADAAPSPLQGTVLAAEAVAFPNFAAVLRDSSAVGRAAMRAVGRAARGCRDGTTDPAVLIRAGLGDHLAAVSESAILSADPWLTATVLEAERIARRLGHWARLLPPDVRPAAERQAARLAASRRRRADWLAGAAERLIYRFPAALPEEQAAILRCLDDLRANVVPLFPVLPDRRVPWWADAVRCLTWAKSSAAGPVLAGHASHFLGSWRGTRPAAVLLTALRGHRCLEAEAVLVKAAASPDAAVRRAALAALGWWESFDSWAVMGVLRSGRTDPDPAVRAAAVAALARIGERAAVRELTEALIAEEPAIRQLAALTAAAEGLTWLWPDLDALADSPDPDTALAACEALERMREQILGPLG